MLRALNVRVRIQEQYRGESCDVIIALHAHKSADSVSRARRGNPNGRIVVALTGTDLYRDLPASAAALSALQSAWRIVVLQPLALRRIPEQHHAKTRVIYQSAVATPEKSAPDPEHFDICVTGHLRDEKAPLLTAAAARLLPASSRVRILQIGRALTPGYEALAQREQMENPRYRWLGELSRRHARRLVASTRAVALTSIMEGGANVISEAITDGVPVIASRIDGSVGLLGPDYPGLFDTGNVEELRNLICRFECDTQFRTELQERCLTLRSLFLPERELQSWKTLLAEI